MNGISGQPLPRTITVTATGRIPLAQRGFGSGTIQILVPAGGLAFKIEGAQDEAATVFSSVPYAVNGVAAVLGSTYVAVAGDLVDYVAGNLNWVFINVTVGTGTMSQLPGEGVKTF